MNQQRCISHKLEQGDSLYNLAQYYRTSVAQIMAHNPGLDPYHLRIGECISICPGEHSAAKPMPEPLPEFKKNLKLEGNLQIAPLPKACAKEPLETLHNEMRCDCMDYLYWMRTLMTDIIKSMPETQAVTNQLMQLPTSLAQLLTFYYPQDAIQPVKELLENHLQLSAEFVRNLHPCRQKCAEQLNEALYDNADALTEQISQLNETLDYGTVWQMLYRTVNLNKQMAWEYLQNHFEESIDIFNEAEQAILELADYFTNGIFKQLPQFFAQ